MASPLANVKPSPRVKLAARLYATGACRTKREASEAAGLHPNYLSMLTSGAGENAEVKRIITETDAMIADKTVETSKIIEVLGRKAIGVMDRLMTSGSDAIAFKAAQDLMDRAGETAKTQKLQVESFSLSGHDAKELAAALVESARERQRYLEAANGLVEIDITAREAVPEYASALPNRPEEDRQGPGAAQVGKPFTEKREG